MLCHSGTIYQRDTCIDLLKNVLDKKTMEECQNFINMERESRHWKTLECQRLKFEWLCQKYKMTTGACSSIHHDDHVQTASDSHFICRNNTWVRNYSCTPLTEVQEWLLAHGLTFAVVLRCPPIGEYITVVEQACQQLNRGRQKSWDVKWRLF